MANTKNLIPKTKDQSREEAKINGRKGGIASGEAKRRKKELRECLEMLLEREVKVKGKTMAGSEAISAKLFEQALQGNIKAFEVIRDSTGQKPIEKVMIAEVEQSVIDEVEGLVNGRDLSN